jgi:glutamate synthase domain-containing protein 1/glutamate synthase domain-containing protein 3
LELNVMHVEKKMKEEMEGGCGVVGFASEKPIAGKHLFVALELMHNRGNGKGGGLAACGCFPDYRDFYALHLGYLKEGIRKTVEDEYIRPHFDIEKEEHQRCLDDFNAVPGLEIKPPDVWRYFIRVRPAILEKFARERGYKDLLAAEDQFLYENSFRLNKTLYADTDEKAAFVLSHGKNLMVLKGVGYAEHFITYYCLEEFKAPIWIGHQRYPTKGRVWHPGGAHPFVGLHEALVHNGDFANYFTVSEYLSQKGLYPLFLTDTEVSVLLFDYYSRKLGYEIEYIIEALAPTTERDFDLLPKKKQRLYRAIRAAHIHGSPDGPWFFIIARYLPGKDVAQLIGITDTSMLRPHVFAYSGGSQKISLVASEKMAVDAVLLSLSQEDPSLCPIAERYWVSRGGSHTDGGSFIMTLKEGSLSITDKFDHEVHLPGNKKDYKADEFRDPQPVAVEFTTAGELFESFSKTLGDLDYGTIKATIEALAREAVSDREKFMPLVEGLTLLYDRQYNVKDKKRNWLRHFLLEMLNRLFDSFPLITSGEGNDRLRATVKEFSLVENLTAEVTTLVIDATGFPQEGEEALASLIVKACRKGVKRFIAYRLKGDRFIGCGLGPRSHGVRIDLYGSSGDYLASGLDGAEIYVHNSAQDQVGQIMNDGKLVIYGDVGQTFLYGAKGGTVYVMGNTAGRPLINSVGMIRAFINGTCLDYAAESFMAGAEVGGGFIVINGLAPNIYGEFIGLEEKYPGSNFFSLASGGAGYLNDPYRTVTEEQLNGGEFTAFTHADWEIVSPYLRENEELFGISVNRDLLTVDRVKKSPHEVFRKVISKGNRPKENTIEEEHAMAALPG